MVILRKEKPIRFKCAVCRTRFKAEHTEYRHESFNPPCGPGCEDKVVHRYLCKCPTCGNICIQIRICDE